MPQTKMNDPMYLAVQYKDASNLKARSGLHERFSVNPYHWHPFVFDHLDMPAECRLLELGCGPGFLWLANLDRIPAGWDITLSDFSTGMLEETRNNLEKRHPFQFKVIDTQSIPFEGRSFDAVIANHMLYHVPDIPAALAEIRRVLKPGGHFYTATNGARHLAELAGLMAKFDSALKYWGTLGLSFRLENAPALLSPFFTDIHLFRYEDALEVTEVDPLLDYALSGSAGTVVHEKRAHFREFLCREMEASSGVIHITKEAGLFVSVPKGG